MAKSDETSSGNSFPLENEGAKPKQPTGTKPTDRPTIKQVITGLDKANTRIDDVEATAERLSILQKELKEEQKDHKELINLGWLVIILTVAGLLLAVFTILLDFLYFKTSTTATSDSYFTANITVHTAADESSATTTRFYFAD